LQLKSGTFSVDALVHAEWFLGFDGEGNITEPTAACDSSNGPPNRRCGQTSNFRFGSKPEELELSKCLPLFIQRRTSNRGTEPVASPRARRNRSSNASKILFSVAVQMNGEVFDYKPLKASKLSTAFT
jgi:hypothetical protein